MAASGAPFAPALGLTLFGINLCDYIIIVPIIYATNIYPDFCVCAGACLLSFCVCVVNTMIHDSSHNELWQLMTCTWFIINPVPTDFLCVMTHTVVLFIQHGKTALDRARDNNEHEVVNYLKEVGKYNKN